MLKSSAKNTKKTFGVVNSYILGSIINASVITMAKSTGNTPVDLFVFPVTLILLALAISIAISILTGYYPAKRATKISTLDALRYE